MKFASTFILVSIFSLMAFAHGEDKLGPNGGFIRMPGAFHTEVVPLSKDSLKLYLLDINWQNPSIKDSDVAVSINEETAKCMPVQDYFKCDFSKKADLNKNGKLIVKASREKAKGNAVTYELPLKLKVVEDDHSKHH